MQNKYSKQAGLTLVEIMIVVAIIGLLAAIAIPNFVRSREKTLANACINNMRQIDNAVQQWALEKGQTTGATVGQSDVTPYLKVTSSNTWVPCPASGAYTLGKLGDSPIVTCSLSSLTPPHAMQ